MALKPRYRKLGFQTADKNEKNAYKANAWRCKTAGKFTNAAKTIRGKNSLRKKFGNKIMHVKKSEQKIGD